jgi:RHS repeat-associated protein
MVTNDAHRSLSEHEYYPFGTTMTRSYQEELNWADQRIDPIHFTGHFRDFLGTWNVDNTDYLDYMHARYYDPNLGRFLSVDPGVDVEEAMHEPQLWNRYSYAGNNPMRYVDPNGRERLPCAEFAQTWHCADVPWRGWKSEAASQLSIAMWFAPLPGEGLVGRLLGGVAARIDEAIGGRLLELGVNRVGSWFEAIIAKSLGRDVVSFNKVIVDAAGRRIGQIDIETSKHLIEVTLDTTGKTKQAAKLVGNPMMNPQGKQVIVYGPNITKAAQQSIEKTGARVIRDLDELRKLIHQ